MKQAALNLNLSVKKTSKQVFLEQMEQVVPWDALVELIAPYYPEGKTGRPPFSLRTMLRVHFMQQWFSLSDPAGLAETLEVMEHELLSHMEKEEQILFPMLKSGGNPFVKQPISMMRAEHVGHGAELDKVLSLTNDATPPQGACNTWRALYAGIAQLNDDLINHIHLENNVLFPQFEAPVPAAAQGCGSSGCGCS
jgi:regulator of cell morphogenesis and NO signaling